MLGLEIGYSQANPSMSANQVLLIRPGDGQPKLHGASGEGRVAVLGGGVLQFVAEFFPIEVDRSIQIADEKVHICDLHGVDTLRVGYSALGSRA